LVRSTKTITKKRLVLVLPSAQAGGAERVFFNLLRSFDRSLFELHLIVIDPQGPYLDSVPSDVVLHRLGYKRVGRAIVRLAAVLRNLKPDVVLSSIVHLNLALLLVKPLLARRTKVFVRESNIPSLAIATGAKNSLFRFFYRILYPYADGVICPGEAIGRDLSKNFGIDAGKMVIIPNPVNFDHIRSKLNSDSAPFQKGRIRLLAAGSLTRQKGFDLLIKAMETLARTKPEIHLTILGDGPEKKNLEDQIASLGLSDFVTLAGVQENPFPYLHHADLFVLSSRWEGMPNVVLESLACGTPVVAFDCSGSVNEIFDTPRQGILVPAGDIEGLVRAIDESIKNGRSGPKDSLLPNRFRIGSVTAQYQNALVS
jgi:glycosyltransferase involved in cell wall biosynthesis